MLVPLQTLFGWPAAPQVTPLEALGLLVGVPLVVIVVAFAVAKGHAVLRTNKVGAGPQPGDPVWMGGRSKSIMGGADDLVPELENAPRRALAANPTPATSEAGTGGASARW